MGECGGLMAWTVVSHALWIAGLAVLLAAFSWRRWAAGEGRETRRSGLALNLGLILVCGGLAATGRGWWERIVWGLLALSRLVWVVRSAG